MARFFYTCAVCGKRDDAEVYYTTVTLERYTDTGMSVERKYICPDCDQELRAWLEARNDDTVRGND